MIKPTLLPPLPVVATEAVSLALTYAGLELGETAESFRRNPVPENYDALLLAMHQAKGLITRAEAAWGITP